VKIMDLITFIKTKVSYTYYPNAFPIDSQYVSDECATVKLTGGFPTRETGVRQPSFQVLIRGKQYGTPSVEAKAYELYDALTNVKEVTIGTSSVVVIRAMSSVPLYIGDDSNGRPIYSLNFDTVVRP
jgi:Bacteriophage minor capsid protein